jgi:catechol 2,3-dioxygenase-like lactoylglutathione lyase family enzyme
MPVSPVFTRIDSVVVRVHDCAASAEWYRNRLGFQVLFLNLTLGVAILDMGLGDSLTIWQLRPDEVNAPGHMAGTFPVFEAVDAAGQRAELIARGVNTSELREVSRLRCFSFWDLDGNRLEACEVVRSREVPAQYPPLG